jgi:hypothetical protein
VSITDEIGARRLARAIVEDMVLYGGEGALGSPEQLAEGRKLFAERVSPELVRILDDEIAARTGGRPLEPAIVAPRQVEVVDGAGAGPAFLIALALAVLVIAGGVAFFLVRSPP